MKTPTAQDVKQAAKSIWKVLPPGAGSDFNVILTRLDYLEENIRDRA